MRSFRPRIQTGRAPGSNRASPGFKPGEPRIQTGRAPGSNRASPRKRTVKSVKSVKRRGARKERQKRQFCQVRSLCGGSSLR